MSVLEENAVLLDREHPDIHYNGIYDELVKLAIHLLNSESSNIMMDATSLVADTWLRMRNQRKICWQNRDQLVAVSTIMMRRILINSARDIHRLKRGGHAEHCSLIDHSEEWRRCPTEKISLKAALKKLGSTQPKHAQIVKYYYFQGFTNQEIAEALDISIPTVIRKRRWAITWLKDWFNGGKQVASRRSIS